MSADPAAVLRLEIDDGIATITLHRPEKRNALNRALSNALWDAVATTGDDPGVAVVILTGADPAFCAGIDLTEIAGDAPAPGAPRPPGEGPARGPDGLYRFLPPIDKPVIGAVNGPAVTGGLEVALQCTFLVASERAQFADTHGRVGIMPGGGVTVLLAQTVGLRRAIEMSVTGNFVAAADALRLGLVNHVVPHGDLLRVTRQIAEDIRDNDQRGVARLLRHYRQLAGAGSLAEAHLIEGLMAETWEPGTSLVAERRSDVMARGRAQRA